MNPDRLLADLHDRPSEEALVAAALREPKGVAAVLDEVGFEASEMYHDDLKEVLDLALFVAHGPVTDAPLVLVFETWRRRNGWKWRQHVRDYAVKLSDLFTSAHYAKAEEEWVRTPDVSEKGDCPVWVARHAAAAVQSMSARRQSVAAAIELLRQAQSPSGPAEELRDGIDSVGG